MKSLAELLQNPLIEEEYEKAMLLKYFKSICDKMKKQTEYRSYVLQLYKETYDESLTTRLIFAKENYEISDHQAKLVSSWMKAHFRKSVNRKTLDSKRILFKKQNGKCAICGKQLGENWSKIHLDHVIPWDLVGDELEHNYQDLCSTCNAEKSNNVHYVFLRLLDLK